MKTNRMNNNVATAPRIVKAFQALEILFLIWLTHAIAFFLHEYAHSFSAWALGYKNDPWALNYGDWSVVNVLCMLKIDENVNYAPLFADGHGWYAAWIAVSGILLGTGLLYTLSRLLYSISRKNNQPTHALFYFWLCVMSIGGFYSYVPIRTFSSSEDMATVVAGLQISPWLILLFIGLPTSLAMWHLFTKLLPDLLAHLYPTDLFLPRLQVVLCSLVVFGYCGLVGLVRPAGVAAYWLSSLSVYLLLPVSVILCWPSKRKSKGN